MKMRTAFLSTIIAATLTLSVQAQQTSKTVTRHAEGH